MHHFMHSFITFMYNIRNAATLSAISEQMKSILPVLKELHQIVTDAGLGIKYMNREMEWNFFENYFYGCLETITECLGRFRPEPYGKDIEDGLNWFMLLYEKIYVYRGRYMRVHTVPTCIQLKYQAELLEALSKWYHQHPTIDAALYQCLQQTIRTALLRTSGITMQQLQDVQEWVHALQHLHHGADGNLQETVCRLLLAKNYNDPDFLHYYFRYWANQIAEEATAAGAQLAWLNMQQEIVLWCGETRPPFYPQKPGCREVLEQMIKIELKKWSLMEQHNVPTRPPQPEAHEAMRTSLNLSELALVLRLLYETGVWQKSVMMDYFRHWSQWVVLNNQKNITAASLKSRYYSPEPTALQKVKDLLLQMRKQLNEW